MEEVPEGLLRVVALQRIYLHSRVPAQVGSTIMHHYVLSPKRRWNPNDQRLFPLGAPSAISTSSRASTQLRYPPVEMRATLLPRDGLQIVLQHPGVLAGNDAPTPDEHASRVRRIVLPDPSLKEDWYEARFTTDGSHFTDYRFFNYLDYLDGRRNPESFEVEP